MGISLAFILALGLAILGLGSAPSAQGDRDGDRDGLSDFHETHKYFTNPGKADSDGDGVPDGDWDERREYTYSVRAVMHVMAPFDVASMNDDYQDVRVLAQTPDLLEFEVVVYPFNTVAEAIRPERGWRKGAEGMQEFLAPGPCCNWDREMQKQIEAELKRDGIELRKLDDEETARRVSKWLMDRSEFEDSFTTFAVDFEEGRPWVVSEQAKGVNQTLAKLDRSLEEQWNRELFGKGMFETRVHGSCTSSAIYLSTGLKAVGLPTRSIICVPILDANDEREVAWIESRLTHNGVRSTLAQVAREMRGAWASHTFNEVWVGGRWRRLNYWTLGQNVLDPEYLGLMVHVNTYNDHAEAGLSPWGSRTSHPQHGALFGGPNPYSCISLSDRFGAHSRITNEPLTALRELSIGRLYWYDDPAKDPIVSLRLDDLDTTGHLIVHVSSDFPPDGEAGVAEFFAGVGKDFVLRARGKDDIPVRAMRGYWLNSDRDLKEFYLRIEPADFARMKKGVEYSLAWVEAEGSFSWRVEDGVGITRDRR